MMVMSMTSQLKTVHLWHLLSRTFGNTRYFVSTTQHMIYDDSKTQSIHAITQTLWSSLMKTKLKRLGIHTGMPVSSVSIMFSCNTKMALPLRPNLSKWTFYGSIGMAVTEEQRTA